MVEKFLPGQRFVRIGQTFRRAAVYQPGHIGVVKKPWNGGIIDTYGFFHDLGKIAHYEDPEHGARGSDGDGSFEPPFIPFDNEGRD